jgi:hypothetical protein
MIATVITAVAVFAGLMVLFVTAGPAWVAAAATVLVAAARIWVWLCERRDLR